MLDTQLGLTIPILKIASTHELTVIVMGVLVLVPLERVPILLHWPTNSTLELTPQLVRAMLELVPRVQDTVRTPVPGTPQILVLLVPDMDRVLAQLAQALIPAAEGLIAVLS